MSDKDPWNAEYFEEKFIDPDPWEYFTSDYEQLKYKRQLNVITDQIRNPRRILEIGSAEGAYTLKLAEQFPNAEITAIEISYQAISRARGNLNNYKGRIEFVNADITKYVPEIENDAYDVCIWSESVYYIGARRSINETYSLLKMIIGKLKPEGMLVMANAVDLPEDIPEAVLTKRPLIDCYYNLLSSITASTLRAIYVEEKLGRIYEYQIWAFIR